MSRYWQIFVGLSAVSIFALTIAAPASARTPASPPPPWFQIEASNGLLSSSCHQASALSLANTGAKNVPQVGLVHSTTGETVISVSAGYPSDRWIQLFALDASCRSVRTFGVDGTDRIALPPEATRHGQIQTLATTSSGGFLVGGTDGKHWLIGRLKPDGQLDRDFGQKGWSVLDLPGEVSAIAEHSSGQILLAGSVGGGCCEKAWVAALDARGHLQRSFGVRGSVQVQAGEDATLSHLYVEEDGSILTESDFGNMGCWGVAVTVLSPTGSTLGKVSTSSSSMVGFAGAFAGGVVPTTSGFELVGTGQETCVGFETDPTASGRIYEFNNSGQHQVGQSEFPHAMLDGAQVVSRINGNIYLIGAPPSSEGSFPNPAHVLIIALTPSGQIDNQFGIGGTADLTIGEPDIVKLPSPGVHLVDTGPSAPIAISDGLSEHVTIVSADLPLG